VGRGIGQKGKRDAAPCPSPNKAEKKHCKKEATEKELDTGLRRDDKNARGWVFRSRAFWFPADFADKKRGFTQRKAKVFLKQQDRGSILTRGTRA